MFKDNIKEFRYKKLYSKDKLADKLDVSTDLINSWENGDKEVDERQVEKLSALLNVSKDHFKKEKSNPKQALWINIILILEAIVISIVTISFLARLDFSKTYLVMHILFFLVALLSKVFFHRFVISEIEVLPIILELLIIGITIILH